MKQKSELVHGEWIENARASHKARRFSSPQFGLLIAFLFLFVGSMYMYEHLELAGSKMLYASRIVLSSVFAVILGFILSIWWSSATSMDKRFEEAERIDREYRELLLSFSDNLFHIVNALNTLAVAPPRPFVVATEFLLGEYVGLLQTRLQRYGDIVAGLGFEADAFLDEKVRIFQGIRERASLSIKGMPKEIQTLFLDELILGNRKGVAQDARRYQLRKKLEDLSDASSSAVRFPDLDGDKAMKPTAAPHAAVEHAETVTS